MNFNKNEDADLRRLMEKDSIKSTVISYLLTIAYAVAAAFACMALREMIETVGMKIIYCFELEAAQYLGFKRIFNIVGLVLMVAVWALTFMITWHRIEKADGMKERIRRGLSWIVAAAAAFAVFGLIQLVVVGYWPTLTGAV